MTSTLLAASTSSSVFSYGSLVVFGIFVFKAFLFVAGGWSDLCVSADDLFLLDAAPASADEAAAVVGIGGGSGASGACCCGGDSTVGGMRRPMVGMRPSLVRRHRHRRRHVPRHYGHAMNG